MPRLQKQGLYSVVVVFQIRQQSTVDHVCFCKLMNHWSSSTRLHRDTPDNLLGIHSTVEAMPKVFDNTKLSEIYRVLRSIKHKLNSLLYLYSATIIIYTFCVCLSIAFASIVSAPSLVQWVRFHLTYPLVQCSCL